jgi:hypothetical protein
MESSAYKRKTANPKMGWSDERRAEFSAKMKKAHADGTWNKKSKKAIGKAISEGRKRWVKFNNRSKAMKKSWERRQSKKVVDFFATAEVNKRLKVRAASPVIEPKSKVLDEVLAGVAEVASDISNEAPKPFSFPEPFETWTKDEVKEFADKLSAVTGILDQAERAFGVRPTLHWILMSAIDEKMEGIFSLLGFGKEGK